MKNLYDTKYAATLTNPLDLRVYTSRLLGQSKDLVLHGGGNTSVKIDDTLYVKGSGWNLDTIEVPGFSPVALDVLLEMVTREQLTDSDMVKEQRLALRNPEAPNPSIEAILHAIIPFKFVDHTHADAVVTISNTPTGRQQLQELYGENMLIVDYLLPGFLLPKHVAELTKNVDWQTLDGIILMNHGIFSFADDAKSSYDQMIKLVTIAEDYISEKSQPLALKTASIPETALTELAALTSELRGKPVFPQVIETPDVSKIENLSELFVKGNLTPEHVIRLKPFPVLVKGSAAEAMAQFVSQYTRYFETHNTGDKVCLDLAPRYAIFEGVGAVALGTSDQENLIISDIVSHTLQAMAVGLQLGGWTSLSPKQVFELEYWELEQAKLKK